MSFASGLLRAFRRHSRIRANQAIRNRRRQLVIESLERREVFAAASLGGTAYVQNFNTLASSGNTTVVGGEFTGALNGWYFLETGSSANAIYTAGNGSVTTGDTYSFGSTSATDRALGGLLSGSVIPTIGVQFQNANASAITELLISYTGEQWRLGATGRADRMDFQYSLNATSLSTGTWTDVNTLDFTAPVTAGSTGALDGNAIANRTSISASITSLNIAPNAVFWLRWNDLNATNADDGLGIDDFSITATAAGDTTPPTVTSIDDGDSDNIVTAGTVMTYTVTFNEDIDHTTVTTSDFDNNGTSAVTIGTITETTAGVFSVQVTPTTAGTLRLRIPTGSVITDVAGNALVVPVSDDTEVTVTSGDVTPPTVSSITDNDADDIIAVGVTVTYTVTFSEDIDEATVSAVDFDNAGSSTVTFGSITETSAGIFSIPVTATTAGTLQLRIPTNASILDLAGNALDSDPAILDGETITVDGTPPMISSITDNTGAGPGFVNQPITFTITFNEDIDGTTVTAVDFDNAGTSAITVGAITETSPGVFSVAVTPTTVGTVRLRIPTTAEIADVAGNKLVVPVLDDNTITINSVTSLAVGDLSIIGYRADASDGLAFVTWVELLPGTSVNFWDSGYIGGGDGTGQGVGGGTWRASENFATWRNTTGSAIVAGTAIVLSFPNLAGRTADLGSVEGALDGLSASGDQIFAGQGQFSGTTASETFHGTLLFGFDFNGANTTWDTSATDAQTSGLPSVLNVAGGNLAITHIDNGQYTGTRQFTTFAAARTAANNSGNWTFEDTGSTVLDSTDFTLISDTTPPTVTSINDDDSDDAVLVDQVVTYTVSFDEDIDAATVSGVDFDNAGTSTITVGAISETSPGVFTVAVTPTSAGTLRLRIPAGSSIKDIAGNELVVPVLDDSTLTVTAADTTPPTVSSIDDGDADNVVVYTTLTYTITFSEDIDESTVTSGDFDNDGTSAITIGSITETGPGVFTVQVTPTTDGTLKLRIPTGAEIKDTAGNSLAPPVSDNDTLTVDGTAPTVTSVADNVSGGPIFQGQMVTYTITFSEDIDLTTISASDFVNAGTATVSFGTIAEPSPGTVTLRATTSSTGTLQLRIPTGAIITDVAGNNLTPPVDDDTTLTVNAPSSNLTAGDVAVIGYNTNASPDSFVIVALRTLTAGTVFYVNDNEIAADDGGSFSDLTEGEAFFLVKAGQSIPAGTVIGLPWGAAAVDATQYVWGSTSGFGLGNNNEEIYLYSASTITDTTPTAFIYGIAIGSSPSKRPSGLTDGSTFIKPSSAAARYKTTGATYSGTAQQLCTAIGDLTNNWESTAPGNVNDWSFTVLQSQTITFNPLDTKTYGDATFDLTATASSGLTVTYVSSDPTIASISGSTVTILKAGETTITASQTGNATFAAATPVQRTLTVNKKALSATSSAANKVYDGTDSATITIGLTGIVGSDAVTGSASGTFNTKNVGTNKTVTVGTVTLGGADAGNYTVGSAGNASADITVKTLTITADAKSKFLGQADPALTYSQSGLVVGDSISGSLTRDAGETAGTYAIRIGTLDAGSNYNTSYNGANLTITALTLTSVSTNGADNGGSSGFQNANQRSMITSLVVTFSGPVTLAAGALTIRNIGLFTASDTTLAASQLLITPNATNDVYTIRFGAGTSVDSRVGTGTRGNSLADGNYRLEIDPTKVTNGGANLTGNNVFGAMAADRFFRLYGDSNGDGRVDSSDTAAIRAALRGGASAYNPVFDWNGDGTVASGVDSTNFDSRINRRRRTW